MSPIKMSTQLIACILAATSFVALADPTCTQQPESTWIPIEQAQQRVEEMGYKIKVFKRTHTSCYELYGHTKQGKRAEIYFNPTNMEKVKEEIDD
ncbi:MULTISPECIES: PepSY domain-containing protein [unclassified Agarivorans]|uniref:PepSY domain-containing protein n=1 Tax=unclassified Agarivorans TaxID=2636026 RepID=UPI003D7D8E8E